MADETRVRILRLLLEAPAATSDLVARLGVDQPRISAHLAALRAKGLVTVSVAGRQHVYTIKSSEASDAIKSFFHLANLRSSQASGRSKSPSKVALREVGRDSPIRRARTCYDHLAGVAGVELLDEMMKRGWLKKSQALNNRRTNFDLTKKGRRALEGLHVHLSPERDSKRTFAYGCLDWTERRFHLGGFLGKVILDSLIANGVVEKAGHRRSRAVTLSRPILPWITATRRMSN
jgi:DNA-binding MarR family transcriptional regulator